MNTRPDGVELVAACRSFGVDHVRAWRWIRAGLVPVVHDPAVGVVGKGRGRGPLLLDDGGLAVLATIARLRREGVSMLKIKRAARDMQRREWHGAKWLCLDARGGAVVVKEGGRVEDVLTGQLFLLLDLDAVRADVDRARRQFGKEVAAR